MNENTEAQPALTTEKFKRIKNRFYRQFLDEGVIKIYDEAEIIEMLSKVKGKRGQFINEARAMVITMYYTGARPIEILRLRAKDFTKEGSFLMVKVPASKRGLPRPVALQLRKPLVKELWAYVKDLYPDIIAFYNFRSEYHRHKVRKNGSKYVLVSITDSLRWYFTQWFDDLLIPYYLRHLRFSKLSMAGVSLEDIRHIKGSKTFESIMPYLHMSVKSAKDIARKND